MCDISRNPKRKQRYTAYCLRGTLGSKVELRHIMFKSGHRKKGKKDLSVVMPEHAQVTNKSQSVKKNGVAGPICVPDKSTYLLQQSMFKEQTTKSSSKSFII